MNIWIVNLIAAFLISAFLAGVMIPKILLISFRKSLFDVPDERKIHTSIVPRLGGLAFKPVIFFTMALLIGIDIYYNNKGPLSEIISHGTESAFIYCSIMLLYVIGVADDLIGVRYRAKFLAQIFCGIMLIAGGISFSDFHGVFGISELPGWLSWFFTIFLVVFISNAINLIDGIDGLCSGLCSVTMLFYGLTFAFAGEYIYSMLAFSTLGVLVPFFYFNVFGNPDKQKKIFMGDTGSLTIGIIISFLSIKISQDSSVMIFRNTNHFILAFAPLIVPCFDVLRVFLHRVRNHKHPFKPDKNHIHHKLLALGLKQRTAMVFIVSVSLVFSFCNLGLSHYMNVNLLILLDIVVWTLGNIWLTLKIRTLKTNDIK